MPEPPFSPFVFQAPVIQAEYREQVVPSYRGNPLAEALPPHYNKEEVFKRIRYQPEYDEAHRHLSLEDRFLMLGHAQRLFEPFPQHFDLVRTFSRMVRDGYVGRNPLHRGYFPDSETKLAALTWEQLQEYEPPLGFNLGFTLTGLSGIGKSRTFERIGRLLPQLIQHTHYQGQRFTWTQLVWFKLDCPYSGSLNELCINFFTQIDAILGTNYYDRYGIRRQPSKGAMIGYMARVARNHSLGALIIDEIQNLRLAHNKEDLKLLSYLVQLDNDFGVPVVLIGTPAADQVLGGELRRARRAAGQGDMTWGRMHNDQEFQHLLEALWKYQYVHEPCELTEELRNTLYYETQGITDLTIKLFFLTQAYAMIRKEERITRDLMRMAARKSMRLVQPLLTIIRSNNLRLLKAFPDLHSQDLEEEFQAELKRLEAEAQHPPEIQTDAPTSSEASESPTPSGGEEVPASVQSTLKPAEGQRAPRRTSAAKDLLAYVEKVIDKRHIPAYDALKELGYIRHSSEYVEQEDQDDSAVA
jgi:hypothetical protein